MSPFNHELAISPAHAHALMPAPRQVDASRRLVDTEEAYEQVLAFWMREYNLSREFLHCEDVLDGKVELYAYYKDGALVGTVGFRLNQGHAVFGRALSSLPQNDVIEISKLCIAKAHRRSVMLRIYRDVHIRLVSSGRTRLAIAAPRWLRSRYRFIGFSGTGVRFPIPGIENENLEIMLSRQMRFGTYGLHTDPIRWNIFLREATEHLLARGTLRLNFIQKTVLAFYRAFRFVIPGSV